MVRKPFGSFKLRSPFLKMNCQGKPYCLKESRGEVFGLNLARRLSALDLLLKQSLKPSGAPCSPEHVRNH